MPDTSTLGQRATRGGVWVFLSYGWTHALTLIQTALLARWLSPRDFGLMGLAMLVVGFGLVVSEPGIHAAVTQRVDVSPSLLNTAWSVLVSRGVILCAVLVLAAPLIAGFFGEPTLIPLLRVMAISLVCFGAFNIGTVLLNKELEFGRRVVFEQSIVITEVLVSLLAGWWWRNVWALIAGYVAARAVGLIASFLIHPYRPRWQWEPASARSLLRFGKYVFGSSIVIYTILNGDDALVGKMLGMTMLGWYTMAYTLSNAPTTAITHVLAQVAFPTYAKVQQDPPQFRRAYLAVLQVTALLAIPLAGGIAVLAPELVRLLLGPAWLPIVGPVRILSMFGVLRSIGATGGPVFVASGRPEIEWKLATGQLALLAVLIYPLTRRWGIMGTGAACAVSYGVFIGVILRAVDRLLVLAGERHRLAMSLWLPALGTIAMMAVITAARPYAPAALLPRCALLVILGGLTYTAVILTGERTGPYQLRTTLGTVWEAWPRR